MAVNAYLVIDGIPGPSTSRSNAIDILSFSFGAANSSVIGPGASGSESRSGRADLSNISVMKVLDKTSPSLFEQCVQGNYLKKVDIIYDKPMGDKQEDYFKIHMEDALITSVQVSGPMRIRRSRSHLHSRKSRSATTLKKMASSRASWTEVLTFLSS